MNEAMLGVWRRVWDLRGVDLAQPVPWLVALRVWASVTCVFAGTGWLLDVVAGTSVAVAFMSLAAGIVVIYKLAGLTVGRGRGRTRVSAAAGILVLIALPILLWRPGMLGSAGPGRPAAVVASSLLATLAFCALDRVPASHQNLTAGVRKRRGG